MNNSFRIAIIVIALLFGINLCASAADGNKSQKVNVREFFKEDPAGIFDLIPKSQRLDMLDYFDSNMTKDVDNAFDGQSRLTAATHDYLCVMLSPGVTVELWVPKPVAKSPVIIANYTYKIPATDGNIKVYGADGSLAKTNWKPTDANDFLLKTDKVGKMTKSDILAIADFPLVFYTIDRASGTVTAHQNIKEQLSAEDYGKVAPYFRDSISFKVKPNGSFSTIK